MALILNIDSALGKATVTLAEEGRVLHSLENNDMRDQASWLHPAINRCFEATQKKLQELDAVAVTIGPGSYTGLRIGLSAAKGLSYALQIPLITLPTLELMARAEHDAQTDLICPVIDARRMEVFTALYNKQMQEVLAPCAMIIDAQSFAVQLAEQTVVFTGNAVDKIREVLHHPNAVFSDSGYTAQDIVDLSTLLFRDKRFADIAYSEPFYVKEFYDAAAHTRRQS